MLIEADRVLAINLNDAGALGIMGNDLAYIGDWDHGRQLVEKAFLLAGPSAQRWWWAIAKDHEIDFRERMNTALRLAGLREEINENATLQRDAASSQR